MDPQGANRMHTMGQDAGYVREAFAGIARRYVLTNHVLSLGADLWWRQRTAALVAGMRPRLVLDLATGSGDLAMAVQRACPDARVLGMDFSVPMMRQAQRSGFPALVAADAMRLPVADDAFDVVTVAFGLRNMAVWSDALGEMRRVLRPGGHVVILDFSLPSVPLLRWLHLGYLKNIMPRVAGVITGKRDAYEYLCQSIEQFPSGRKMEGFLEQCGFTAPVARPLTFGIASLYSARKPDGSK